MEEVRDSCACVASHSSHVFFDSSGIEKAVDSRKEIPKVHWDFEGIHYFDGGSLTVQYLFVLDALNFCFWPDEELNYDHLALDLKKALEHDKNVARLNYDHLVFDPLSYDQLSKVARLQIRGVVSRLAERGIALIFSDAALDYVLAQSYDPAYGARPIRRWLERKVVTELSKMLVRNEINENSTVYVDSSNGGLVYHVGKNDGAMRLY